MLRKLWKNESGQDLTEYALLMVFIALVAIAAMGKLGLTISNIFVNASTNLTTS